TTALITVTSGIKKRISFVTGHGEATTSGFNGRDVAGLNELLNRENYDVDEVNLLESDISFETNLIAIIAPQRDFLDTELEKIRTFIKGRSGHLLVALDPLSETRNLEKFLLQDFGVLANHDVVIDPRGIQRQYWTVAPVMTNHPALSPIIDSNLVCIMFHCRSLTAEGREGFTPVTYLETIENSWAKRNLKAGDEISLEYEEGKDARGPLKLAIALEGTRNATASRILVFGDADFAGNAYISFGGNKDLIINSINWMLGQEKMISIRPKTVEIPEIVLDDAAANQIFTFCVIVSPLMVVFLGGLVFLLRRRM
ncbi:MAG: Gldg family protein, partial [Candidatus Riflebacteria bacterium]